MALIRPKHAASLVQILRRSNLLTIRGAEVGVLAGAASQALLRGLPQLFLWMVDAWTSTPTESAYFSSGDSASRLSQAEHLANLHQAFERTAFANDRRMLVRSDSSTAAGAVPVESLDFVFIDADHTYDGVRRDIAAWSPKVRIGGVLAGHDYGGIKNRRGFWGVNRAVDEYVAENGFQLNFAPGRVWWLEKKPVPRVVVKDKPVQAVRVVYGDIAANKRLRSHIQEALKDGWAREEVVHFVAGVKNAVWLSSNGARQVELVCEQGLLPEVAECGSWFMKTYLIDQAVQRYNEILYLDFDCRVLRTPDDAMWQQLRLPSPTRFSRSLQAQNVAYRRPVCLRIHRNRSAHSVRRCLNSSVLYCRDRKWTTAWLAAYEDAIRHGLKPSNHHDETFLIHAIDSICGVLDSATMVAEFEIPIASLRRNIPEAKAHKQNLVPYFHHR